MKYLDYAAACPMRPEIAEKYTHYCQLYAANPHNLTKFGEFCRRAILTCERRLLATLNISEGEANVIWCGSATEALNLAIFGFLAEKRCRVAYDPTAHPAMLKPLQAAVYSPEYLSPYQVSATGKLQARPDTLADCGLLCLCQVNNETGVCQSLQSLQPANLARSKRPVLCVDAAQSYGKIPIPWTEAGIDLLAISAHKIGGPAGIGALVVRKGLVLKGQILGGGQQHGLRSGSIDTVAVQMFTEAAEISCRNQTQEYIRLLQLNNYLRAAITRFPEDFCHLLSPPDALPQILCLAFPNREGAIVARWLAERYDILVGSGSACSAESKKPSSVLTAMGLTDSEARSSIRLSLGYATQQDDIAAFLAALPALATDYPLAK